MYRLYMCDKENVNNCKTKYLIKEEKPSFFRTYKTQKCSFRQVLKNMYWWLISRGKYRIYCAYDGDRLVHTSYVIPRCFKFPFLQKNTYEIGPCFTDALYRGQGIYPAVLSEIVKTNSYMIIDDKNYSSIKGAAKAGFSKLPGSVEKSLFLRYHYRE